MPLPELTEEQKIELDKMAELVAHAAQLFGPNNIFVGNESVAKFYTREVKATHFRVIKIRSEFDA